MASPSDSLSRAVLPIPDKRHIGHTTYDAKDKDTAFPPIVPLRPPTGAPNVLIVLLDDAGFAASSAFGGVINTPTAERLARNGLRYNRFHTTALCSPTRAAMLSGRNHHTVGMGGVTEIATSAPGYNSMRPNTCAPVAEILKLNGYSTAQFGKCHEVPVWQSSPMGPFDAWPTGGGGFEHFYGFLGGETNQWYPDLVENTTTVAAPGRARPPRPPPRPRTDRPLRDEPPVAPRARGAGGRTPCVCPVRPRPDARGFPSWHASKRLNTRTTTSSGS